MFDNIDLVGKQLITDLLYVSVMCALSSDLVTFLFERLSLNIDQVLKMERNRQQANFKKKNIKDRYTDQNVWFFLSLKTIMAYKHNSDCFCGLKISTRKLKFILLKISVLMLSLFGGMMIQVSSPRAPSSLYLLGFEVYF